VEENVHTLQDRLDTIARTYNTTTDFDRFSNEMARRLIRDKAFGTSLLEVGCGWGDMTLSFAPHFERIVAFDGSQEFAAGTRERCSGFAHVEVHHSLLETFTTDLRFDDIVFAHVLEHVDEPVACLRRLAGLLTPRGQLHIVVPNARSLHRRLGKAMGLLEDLHEFSARDIQLGHQRVYDLASLSRDVHEGGLQIVDVEGIMLKPLSNAQMEQWDPRVINGLLEVGREVPDLCNELYARTTLA
jgi:2-polyprenyl-3-methyl-5-hydroxy-6-metoxy-1,4-benzoquinol methylase